MQEITSPVQKQAYESLYHLIGIPFAIADYRGNILFCIPDDFTLFFQSIMHADPPDQLKSSSHPAGVTIVETDGMFQTAVCRIDERGYFVTAPVLAFSEAVVRPGNSLLSTLELTNKYADRLNQIPPASIAKLNEYASQILFIACGRIPDGMNFYEDMRDTAHTLHQKEKEPEVEQMDPVPKDYHDLIRDISAAVKSGDTVTLHTLLSAADSSPVFSSSPLQNSRYAFLLTIQTAAKAICENGADPSYVNQFADSWCRSADAMHSTPEVNAFLERCLLKLCTMASEYSKVRNVSPVTAKTYLYVKRHPYEQMNVNLLAEKASINRNSLSAAFNKEMHISLHDFIIKVKLEESIRLLHTTDLSGSDIAAMLKFSSQSHFVELFRKAYGLTPDKARKTGFQPAQADKDQSFIQ